MKSASRLGDLVKIIAPILKKNRDGYLLSAKEEIDIIGMEATDQEVYFLADILLSSSDIGDALVTLSSVNDGDIEERAEREKARLVAYEQKVNADAKAAADRRVAEASAAKETKRIAEEQAVERKLLAEEISNSLASALATNPSYTEYQDYTVVSRVAVDQWTLRRPVREAMMQGWIPVGGVHIVSHVGLDKFLFSQAMALPANKPKSSLAPKDSF
jgi:hypothetical protein